MTRLQFEELEAGDLVRHKLGSEAYIVHANYGSRITAVRTADLINPDEWDQVTKGGEVMS